MASSEEVLVVGNRGEIYTNDELRMKVGMKKGGKVRARVSGNRLVLEPLPSLKDVLLAAPLVVMTAQEAEELSEEAQKEAGAYG